jgi:hypothetical protein
MTEEKYHITLALLAENDPNHPLLGELRTGFSKWNVLFLQQALKGLSPNPKLETRNPKTSPPSVSALKIFENTPEEEVLEGYKNDAVSTDLAVRMRHLIGVKRSLSNQLFDFQDNVVKCKELSGKILAYEKDIEALREQLRYYNDKGHLPPEPTTDKGETVFPTTKYELDKALRGVRSMISQVQDECEQLTVNGEMVKLKKREQRLVELKVRKEQLETRLKEATI